MIAQLDEQTRDADGVKEDVREKDEGLDTSPERNTSELEVHEGATAADELANIEDGDTENVGCLTSSDVTATDTTEGNPVGGVEEVVGAVSREDPLVSMERAMPESDAVLASTEVLDPVGGEFVTADDATQGTRERDEHADGGNVEQQDRVNALSPDACFNRSHGIDMKCDTGFKEASDVISDKMVEGPDKTGLVSEKGDAGNIAVSSLLSEKPDSTSFGTEPTSESPIPRSAALQPRVNGDAAVKGLKKSEEDLYVFTHEDDLALEMALEEIDSTDFDDLDEDVKVKQDVVHHAGTEKKMTETTSFELCRNSGDTVLQSFLASTCTRIFISSTCTYTYVHRLHVPGERVYPRSFVLQCSKSEISRRPLANEYCDWTRMCKLLPDVCLSRVSKNRDLSKLFLHAYM